MPNLKNKNPVSNNILSVLIGITILVSIIGSWISINKLSPLTGYATTIYGSVNVTINCAAGVSFNSLGGITGGSVNFTAAAPGESRLTTNPSDITSGPFNITNDGSSLINVTISSTPLFNSPSANTLPNKYYSFNGTKTSNLPSCPPNANYPSWQQTSSTPTVAICRLNFTDGSDTALVHINITVPPDEPSGARNATITFTAISDTC
jgi:hypothetical protein